MPQAKRYFIILSIILILINLIGLIALDTFKETRIIKLLSSSIIFLFFLRFKGYRNTLLLLAFICILISDVFLLNFETPLNSKGVFTSSIIAYLLMAINIIPKLKKVQLKFYLLVFFSLIIILNIFLIKQAVSMVDFNIDIFNNKIFFYAYGSSLLVLGVVGGLYNYLYGSKKSAYAVLFIFGFVLSSIFNLFAFYFDVEFFQYSNRILYIITLTIFSLYAILPLEEKSILYDEDLFD